MSMVHSSYFFVFICIVPIYSNSDISELILLSLSWHGLWPMDNYQPTRRHLVHAGDYSDTVSVRASFPFGCLDLNSQRSPSMQRMYPVINSG